MSKLYYIYSKMWKEYTFLYIARAEWRKFLYIYPTVFNRDHDRLRARIDIHLLEKTANMVFDRLFTDV